MARSGSQRSIVATVDKALPAPGTGTGTDDHSPEGHLIDTTTLPTEALPPEALPAIPVLREPVPDPVSLDLFVTTVTAGSLSKAAELCSISQPSATARIRKLESQLGLTLLERTTRGSTPTAAGRLVAGWAAAVLSAMGKLVVGTQALAAGQPDPLRLVASYTVAEYLLPGWLEVLHRRFPEARFELAVANSSLVADALRTGRADLGFVETPTELEGISCATVSQDRLAVIATPETLRSHGLDGAGRSVTPETLCAFPIVLREPGSGTRETFDRALALAGIAPFAPLIQVGSTTALKGAVMSSSVFGVLSDMAVTDELSSGALEEVDVPGLDLGRELRVVWIGDHPGHPLARHLISLLTP